MLLMEAKQPAEYVGPNAFTLFFAVSSDLIHWTFLSYDKGFSKERYIGGPYLRYSQGWYYLLSVTELPCARFTNYIYRTKDFDTWEVDLYNPILMPSNEDRMISPYAFDLDDKSARKFEPASYPAIPTSICVNIRAKRSSPITWAISWAFIIWRRRNTTARSTIFWLPTSDNAAHMPMHFVETHLPFRTVLNGMHIPHNGG